MLTLIMHRQTVMSLVDMSHEQSRSHTTALGNTVPKTLYLPVSKFD